ncbi:MAG TPA: hypothetical protein VF880_17510 [Actinomycetes bacterium]|jgi:hypothetical protein
MSTLFECVPSLLDLAEDLVAADERGERGELIPDQPAYWIDAERFAELSAEGLAPHGVPVVVAHASR